MKKRLLFIMAVLFMIAGVSAQTKKQVCDALEQDKNTLLNELQKQLTNL